MSPENINRPADWYVDPINKTRMRWWDGENWTDDIQQLPPPPKKSESKKPEQEISLPTLPPPQTLDTSANVANNNETRFATEPIQTSNLVPPNINRIEIRKTNIIQAIECGLKGYVRWNGRATRSEFWWWVLFAVVGNISVQVFAILNANAIVSLPPNFIAAGYFGLILSLFLPTLSLMVRRLRDAGLGAGASIILPIVTIVMPLMDFGLSLFIVTSVTTYEELRSYSGIQTFTFWVVVAWYIFMWIIFSKNTVQRATPWDEGYCPKLVFNSSDRNQS